MGDKEKLELDMSKLKDIVKEEVNKAWKDGFSQGTILTCATLYKTFSLAGLEGSNVLFAILKDIAKGQGCGDLEAKVAEMKGGK
jgi:hypothetical protein